jgi:hypothetical protein
MEANGTKLNGSDSLEVVDFGDMPGFVAYNIIMFFFILIPVTILDVLLLTALFLEKITPVQIRIILINMLLGSLCVSFGLALEHLTALSLSIAEYPVPSFDFCHFIVWFLAGSGAVRMIFTAVFSIVVFILVKSSAKAVKEKVLVVVCIVLWITAFFVSAPLLSPVIVGSKFLGKTACAPKNTAGIAHRFAYILYIPAWGIICGLVPLGITIVIPLLTVCYLKSRNISGNVAFKKAMAKFSLFLLIGVTISFLGQVVPPLLTAVLFRGPTVSTPFVVYAAFILMNLSLIPTPVLILVYLGGARKKLKEIVLCYCIRFRDDMSKVDHSRSGSVGSKHGSLHRNNTGLSDISMHRQNTGLSEVALFRQDTGLSEASLKRQDTGTIDVPSNGQNKRLSDVPEEREK